MISHWLAKAYEVPEQEEPVRIVPQFMPFPVPYVVKKARNAMARSTMKAWDHLWKRLEEVGIRIDIAERCAFEERVGESLSLILERTMPATKKKKASSMPDKPAKFRVNKGLKGKAIKVGYIDSKAVTGIITNVEPKSPEWRRIKYWEPASGASQWLDSMDQVIAIGEVKYTFSF